jgi:hypothetical protein
MRMMNRYQSRGRRQVTVNLAALFLVAGLPALTQGGQTEPPEGHPRLSVPRIESAPKLADFEGMKPGGVALKMTMATGLVDRLPRDGTPMTERTEVYFGYDDRHLYAAFLCFDSDPTGIRAHMNGRDRVPESEDSIALQIDTFRDRKHAYGFQANPLGVQQDGLWTEGKGWDLSFDTVWRTESKLTDAGYIVLVSVPFRSLRFPRESMQTWGFLVYRGIARKNEEGFWPPYSTRIAGRMNQAASMEGLKDVSPGKNAQLVPYMSARSFRTLEVDPQEGGHFVNNPGEAEVGADAKVVVKDSLSLDLTANPDFSQVESDEPQVTVNKRFETFFPEKRPFFLENASYFDTPIQLLFSRRIANPDVGGRLTGRLGRIALGALVVRDQTGSGSAATDMVLRVNRDFGNESSVGLFASSRNLGSDTNRVVGLDTRVKFGANWFATAQAVASATRETGANDLDGPAYRATVSRAGRRFAYNADFNDRSPEFRTALGYIERTDLRSLDQTASYRWMPASSRLLSFGPELSVSEVRDHEGDRLDRAVTPKFSFEWPGLTKLQVFYQDANVRLRPEEVPSLRERVPFSQNRAGLEFSTSFTRSLSLTLRGSTGEGINLVPKSSGRPHAADLDELSFVSEVRPSTRLSLSASYLLTRLRQTADRPIFTDHILRGRVNYQFTRALSLRAIVQYDALQAAESLTSLEDRRNLNVDVLFTFLRGPGTALYVGYNNNLQNLDPSLRLGARGLLRTPSGLLSDGRQFFIKASYLLRK